MVRPRRGALVLPAGPPTPYRRRHGHRRHPRRAGPAPGPRVPRRHPARARAVDGRRPGVVLRQRRGLRRAQRPLPARRGDVGAGARRLRGDRGLAPGVARAGPRLRDHPVHVPRAQPHRGRRRRRRVDERVVRRRLAGRRRAVLRRAAQGGRPGRALKVLVAGATGAIGRALVPQLRAAGHEVIALTRSPDRAAALGAQPAVSDVYDAAAVRAAVADARPDAVIDELTDLACSPRDPKTFAANDRMRLEGSPNVLAAARAARVERYLVQSVAFFAQSGPGRADEDVPLATDSPMGEGVRAVATLEARVREAGGTILRYGFLYGPGTWYAPGGALAEAVRRRRYPVIGDGGAAGSFVHVEDAAAATVAALEGGAAGTF